ncbi:Tyrosineprotein kinase Abllike, partial [Caligus rogercresseyi]
VNRDLNLLVHSKDDYEEDIPPLPGNWSGGPSASSLALAIRASTRTAKTFPDSRDSRSSPRASQRQVPIAALDERNLKRAVNRYGTLPK